MAGEVQLDDNWLVLTDSRYSLGTVRVGVGLPPVLRGSYSPLTEATVFPVTALAVRQDTVEQWGWFRTGEAVGLEWGATPRALQGVEGEQDIVAMLGDYEERRRCTGQLKYRRSLGGVAAALWESLRGPAGPLSTNIATSGLLEYGFRYLPPPPHDDYFVMDLLYKFRHRL